MSKNSEQSLNKHLELTPEAEIKRLKAVIEQKNKAIEAFKEYDAKRKMYYQQFEDDYKQMKKEFDLFVEKVRMETNYSTAKQISKMFTSYGHYGEKYNILEGLIQSAFAKITPLENNVRRLLYAEPVMLAWCDKSRYKILVEKINSQFTKIKEVLDIEK